MNYARWSNNLLTGNREIDQQHKAIFDQAEKLFGWAQVGKAGEQLEEIFKFLENYIENHFQLEEKLQRQLDYPYYEQHRGEHNEYRRRYQTIKGQYNQNGPSLQLTMQTITFTLEWLTEHIHKCDKELASFIKYKSQSDATVKTKIPQL